MVLAMFYPDLLVRHQTLLMGENIGVMAITRVYSVWIIRGAALLAIAFSLIGKVSAAISTIPNAVMGGITMLLYGVIAVQGFRMFVEQKVDFSKNSNMVSWSCYLRCWGKRCKY